MKLQKRDVKCPACTRDPAGAGCAVLAVVDALSERTRRHFRTEEVFLREIRFPGYEGHCREHRMQLAELTDLRRTLCF